jgi:hypothetical protein
MLQGSVTSRTCNNGYRMALRLFLRHLEFSSESQNYFAGVQRPALKLKMDTLGIFFHFYEAVTRKPCFRKFVFMNIFLFLVLWCNCIADSPSTSLAASPRPPSMIINTSATTRAPVLGMYNDYPGKFSYLASVH